MAFSDLLTDFVAPEHVRIWGFLAVERYVQQHGYAFARRGGNIYGALKLVPMVATSTPKMRLVIRSDVAAVYGSSWAA